MLYNLLNNLIAFCYQKRFFSVFAIVAIVIGGIWAHMTLDTEAGPVFVSTRDRAGPKAAIYFGGNADDVSLFVPGFAKAFPDGALYLVHYRGYGGSAGADHNAISESPEYLDLLGR